MKRYTRRFQRPLPTRIVVEPVTVEPFTPTPPPKFPSPLADQLAKLIPPLKVPKEVEVVLPEKPIAPVLTQEIKQKYYKNFTIDLSVAHEDEPLGLREMGIVADTMTVIRADSSFSYKLNSTANDSTPAEKGLTETDFEIEEIYITNAAASGQAIIRVAWNPYLIRLKPS